MADNYIEKRMEELREGGKRKVIRRNKSIDTLLRLNRSYRGYSSGVKITRETLREIISVVPFAASGMNAQTLRFRPVPSDECHLVHPYVTLGAALPEEHLPHPGEEPAGYIAVCCTGTENKVTDIDLGIAAQSMLLKAVDMGLNGIVILNFRAEAVMEALGLPSKPICLIAIGKGTERIFLVSARPGDSLSYYRKDGIHYVPKLSVDDLLI